ncbi:hypothetical protein J6590_039725 [Homalodisca vitripennis]|nr:hypothetical protein J6590_039725 [Homalodisca vitripennis]
MSAFGRNCTLHAGAWEPVVTETCVFDMRFDTGVERGGRGPGGGNLLRPPRPLLPRDRYSRTYITDFWSDSFVRHGLESISEHCQRRGGLTATLAGVEGMRPRPAADGGVVHQLAKSSLNRFLSPVHSIHRRSRLSPLAGRRRFSRVRGHSSISGLLDRFCHLGRCFD